MLLTPWQRIEADWNGCRRCSLCDCRKHVVLARGSVPCDVFFVGEAPGQSEDALRKPFIGPAGHELDAEISVALERLNWPSIAMLFSNLVACIPLDDEKKKTAEPPKEAIEACAPRLVAMVQVAQPRVIVCVGDLATKWIPKILAGDYGGERKKAVGVKSAPGVKPSGDARLPQRGVAAQAVGGVRIAGAKGSPPGIASITHPSAIIRANQVMRPLMAERNIVALTDIFEELA